MDRMLNFAATGALCCFLTLAPAASFAAGDFLYAEVRTSASNVNSVAPIPINGLQLTLPAASTRFNTAIVTLNMPNLFLSQNTSPTVPMSATIQIVVISSSGIFQANGSIGCDNVNVATSGVKPITIALKVPLDTLTQAVTTEWLTKGATVTNQTFASISAILVKE